jgi:DNA mismatch repair protein MutL
MEHIERLPDDLVNKIAAGEVVERPASVVKELLENAVDALASSITVEIEGGGKTLVRVRDDGVGMNREDAALSIERHATSKLRTLHDLESIATHGFRGEALPSIASVSHIVLRTRDSGPVGTEVEVRHGRLVEIRDAGHPRGTTVEVRDLFGAVPARRKFLRADSTEAAHVAESVTLLAIARSAVGFVLMSGGRPVIQAPPVADVAARLYQIFGGAFLDDLLGVEGGESWAKVAGFVSRPDRPSPSRATLRLFVNGRAVKDRSIAKALSEAYRVAGAGDRRPEAFLFLEVPAHMIDVNVHPAKTEIRFADPRTVWTAVERSVRAALSSGARSEPPRADTTGVTAAVAKFLGSPPNPESSLAFESHEPTLASVEGPLLLGQHRQTYIVASDGEDLILVDQHTAHERVRFEALVMKLEDHSVESQRLIVPLVLVLPPRLVPVLEEHAPNLAVLGFDVEPFGGTSVRLAAGPAILGGRDPGPFLEGILKDLLERETAEWAVSGSRDRLAATLACHSSVRAGERLSPESMRALLSDLGRTLHPTLCPHGRPTSVRIPREDVSRWFGRTGWKRS